MDDFSNYPKSLSEKRSEQERNASLWTPRDVLIDTLRALDAGEIEADALIVVSTKDKGNGVSNTRWVSAGPSLIITLGMLTYAQQRMVATAIDDE